LPLTVALNSLNQSMGQPEAYPFVLAPAVIDKLELVHEIIHKHPSSAPVSDHRSALVYPVEEAAR